MAVPDGHAEVQAAMRLGWYFAEARGRNWWQGPGIAAGVGPAPQHVLPLRPERPAESSRQQAVDTLAALVSQLHLGDAEARVRTLQEAIPPYDPSGVSPLGTVDDPERTWRRIAAFFGDWDAQIQDELARRDDMMANSYLLGRGLAECYWGMGPVDQWGDVGAASAISLPFLLSDARRQELTRLPGRLGPGFAHPMTAAAISGSLEAWWVVANHPEWSRSDDVPACLYEQSRRWYELLILGQDPTTLLRPYSSLHNRRSFLRVMKLFAPQLILAVVAIILVAVFFAIPHGDAPDWVKSVLATGSVGALAAAGLFARAQTATQHLLTRLRQDAYTDLVAAEVATVPEHPRGRRGRAHVEEAVRRRRITVPSSSPDIP